MWKNELAFVKKGTAKPVLKPIPVPNVEPILLSGPTPSFSREHGSEVCPVFPLHPQLFQVKGHSQEEQLRADIGPVAGEEPAEAKIVFQQGKGADESPWERQCAGRFPCVSPQKSSGDTTLWATPGSWAGSTGCGRGSRYSSHTGTRRYARFAGRKSRQQLRSEFRLRRGFACGKTLVRRINAAGQEAGSGDPFRALSQIRNIDFSQLFQMPCNYISCIDF